MDEVMQVKGHTGTVRFDGRMITILRTGFLARASVGKGEKQIPLSHVTAVQFKPAGPLVNGFISSRSAAAMSVGPGSGARQRALPWMRTPWCSTTSSAAISPR
jgi:hypothetical protein